MPADHAPTALFPDRRVVVLGASNVTRNISTVVETACQVWGRPADILVAAGYGRSYGWTSRVLARRLPPILKCGLWENFFERPPAPTAALLTDIGNDIVYGASVADIVGWVTECLDRLAPRCERIVMTELPLASVSELDEFRFIAMRSLLFPKSTLQLDHAIERATQLNAAIADLALKYRAKLISTERAWYGLDPIHTKVRHAHAAWRKILGPWRDDDNIPQIKNSWPRWWYLRTRRPLVREMFGVTQHTPQPSARLSDGTIVSQF